MADLTGGATGAATTGDTGPVAGAVATQPTDVPLIQIQQVKDYLGIKQNEDNNILTFLVAAASTWFKHQTLRDYVKVTQCTERVHLDVRNWQNNRRPFAIGCYPKNSPVTQIYPNSVFMDGVAISQQTDVAQPGWVLNGDRLEIIGFKQVMWWFWPPVLDPGWLTYTYDGGFDVVPHDVQQAVLSLVAWRYRERTRVGLNSRTTEHETFSFSQNEAPADVKLTIDWYRRPNLV